MPHPSRQKPAVDDNFHRCLFPGRHRVLGRALRLFSFWHLLTLHAVGSPFLNPEGEASLADLLVATKICRSRWPRQPNLKPSLLDRVLFWRRKRDRAFIELEMARFAFYMLVHESGPAFWTDANEIVPKRLSAPAVLARVSSLMRRTNLSQDEIWNGTAPGYAAWIDGAMAEQEGGEIRFVRPEDEEEGEESQDLNLLGEEELFAIVVKDLGMDRAMEWRRARLRAAAGGDA